jgi:TRAP-type C4-dicarboxylate transport system permease small subunit
MTRQRTKRAIRILHLMEDALLVVLLTGMIGLSFAQILLRNLFETGLPWADPVLRLLVLWLGLAGALAATRENRHIRIDLVPRLVPFSVRLWLNRAGFVFTALVCGILGWHGARLVWFEYQDGTSVAAGIPAWLAEIVIPVGFALMALRFGLLALHPKQPTASTESGQQA